MTKDYYFSLDFPVIITADDEDEAYQKLAERIDVYMWNGKEDLIGSALVADEWRITKVEDNTNK